MRTFWKTGHHKPKEKRPGQDGFTRHKKHRNMAGLKCRKEPSQALNDLSQASKKTPVVDFLPPGLKRMRAKSRIRGGDTLEQWAKTKRGIQVGRQRRSKLHEKKKKKKKKEEENPRGKGSFHPIGGCHYGRKP